MNIFLTYLAIAVVWPLIVVTYDAVRRIGVWAAAIVQEASDEHLRMTNLGIGIGLVTSGTLGSVLGITASSSSTEILVRMAAALAFLVIGSIIILLNLKGK